MALDVRAAGRWHGQVSHGARGVCPTPPHGRGMHGLNFAPQRPRGAWLGRRA